MGPRGQPWVMFRNHAPCVLLRQCLTGLEPGRRLGCLAHEPSSLPVSAFSALVSQRQPTTPGFVYKGSGGEGLDSGLHDCTV